MRALPISGVAPESNVSAPGLHAFRDFQALRRPDPAFAVAKVWERAQDLGRPFTPAFDPALDPFDVEVTDHAESDQRLALIEHRLVHLGGALADHCVADPAESPLRGKPLHGADARRSERVRLSAIAPLWQVIGALLQEEMQRCALFLQKGVREVDQELRHVGNLRKVRHVEHPGELAGGNELRHAGTRERRERHVAELSTEDGDVEPTALPVSTRADSVPVPLRVDCDPLNAAAVHLFGEYDTDVRFARAALCENHVATGCVAEGERERFG